MSGDRQDDPLHVTHDDLRELLGSGDRPFGPTLATRIAVGFGALLHLAAGALIAATGLVAPPWATALFGAVWVGAAWLGWWWRRRRPVLVLLLPFATLGVVGLALTAGDAWLGWTA